MKKILLLLPLIILFSCSVQKRKYQKGFYVINNKAKSFKKKENLSLVKNDLKSENLIQKANLLQVDENTTLEASAEISLKPIKVLKHGALLYSKDEPCDVITLKNGDEIQAKILEITPIEIKYKKCNLPDGPLYIVKKSDAFMIKYANGTKEIIKSDNEQVSSNSNKSATNTGKPKSTPDSAVAAIIAGICGIFLGIGSIPAIILGDIALKKIKAEPDKYEGGDMAMIGKVLGIIGLVLKILLVILIFAIIFSL